MSMSEADIKAKVKEFITNNFLLGKSADLKEADSFLDSGIVDSTGVLEIVDYLQDAFEIKVNDEELLPDNLDSISNITRFVKSKLA
jgi:acyl carrier protein